MHVCACPREVGSGSLLNDLCQKREAERERERMRERERKRERRAGKETEEAQTAAL